MILFDRIAAGLVAAYVLVAFGDVMLANPSENVAPNIAIGLVPAVLLLIPRTIPMLLVTLISLPCCFGACMYADIAQIPPLADHMLYEGSWFMLGVGLYALVRTVQLFSERKARLP